MAEEEGAAEKPARKLPDTQTLLVLVNSLLVFGALGTMIYTKLLYQRPPIVEEVELKNRIEEIKKPISPADVQIVTFDQMTVNLAMTSGKAHYATLTFAVECRDVECASVVKGKRALFIDRVIAALGRRQLTELNTIQGKLLLKTDLMHQFNEVAPAGSVGGVFFSDFILQ